MKKYLATLLLCTGLMACKKKSAVQEDLVILAMTTGKWKVTSFTEAGSDRTTEFQPYRFKYNTNNTVDAYRDGIIEKTGNWNGSASTQSIFAEFMNVSQPLLSINGTWNITRNSRTYVEASQNQNGQAKTLRLDKE